MDLCHSGTGEAGGEQKELLDFFIAIPYTPMNIINFED